MVTTVGLQDDPIALLNALITLDFDAAEAYEAAIARLDERDYAETLRAFMGDHRRHTVELSALVRGMGGAPAAGPGMKSLLTTGKVMMADLAGDRAILMAMRSNEADTNTAYERAVGHEHLSPETRRILEANLADERRHKAWIERTLDQDDQHRSS